ncbi:MAG TPA: LytTR family DNA-binding domain-containing protein [Chitinophaga sp.]|jgi:DNA-binding LytR/AlgR family response regulator|uniref:LytR/AlgR family response regulator transcription factor n=1 Tax=Chitinophaga sp. TaxID=1869181 RepID=UPI002DB705AD|nr:LytTR family DNA-binding domain-containing protein [Chitinophaga sp.]HEU4554304.1 LytTR family DNA-binding domain-containing protein [Chitinophaga sp.]
MMQCLAIDDEKLVLELLEDNIRQVPFLHLVKACRNAMEATAVLQSTPVDLLFLDIQMPGLSGLQLLQTLPHPPMTILITAYEQYALESYNLDVVDYLLKPVSFERFMKACNKAHDRFLRQSQTPAPAGDPQPDHFFVNVEYTLVKVLIADILYIEGLKDYIKIHVASSKKPVITRMSMKAIEEKLPPAQFVRTHKSFIIAASRITAIKRDLVCLGELELPLSEFYKGNLDKAINRM